MKIECVKEKFVDAIQKAERVTGKNLTTPVLKCIHLQAERNNLTIRATNLDLGIEINLPVKVEVPGLVAVPGAVLLGFVQNLQHDKNVTLESTNQNLSVSTPLNSTVIKALSHEEFPSIPSLTSEKTISIPAKEFIRGLKAVWYSSGTSQVKPELSSVFIHSEEDELVFVATDSFRLAEKRVRMKKAREFPSILIPLKNIPEIIRILEEISGEIEVAFTKNQISFSADGLYLTSRLVDGVFPDYKQILPKGFKTEAVVLKEDLISSLKIAHIFSDKFNQVSVSVRPSEKLFQLRTKNAEIGENTNKLKGAISGEDVDINFNHRYITDCFQSVDSDSVSLEFNGLSKPVVIRGVSDKTFMYLVMPMNK